MEAPRLKKNLSWILAGNVLHAVFAFLLNIYVARVLTLDDNGLINYAASLITFFTSVGTLGFNGVITKLFAEDEAKAGSYLCTCIVLRTGFSIIAIIVLQVIVRIANPTETTLHVVVLCQSMSILFSAFDLFIYWFRYNGRANVTAILRIASFAIAAIWRIIALSAFQSLVGYVIGVAMETLLLCGSLAWYYMHHKKGEFQFSRNLGMRALRLSYPFIFSAMLVTIYGQVDKIMLKSMIDNTAVALYSVSVTLASCISIIPQSLIEAFRPDIMDQKQKNEIQYQRRLRQLYAIVFWICIAYGLFIAVFAKQIIFVLYGEKYLGAVSSLALIVWYTSFSYFGAINSMYMVAEDKIKWVQVSTFVGAMLNGIMNFCFIPIWGILGAALASLITQFIANFIFMWAIKDLRKGFKIMVQGISLQNIR